MGFRIDPFFMEQEVCMRRLVLWVCVLAVVFAAGCRGSGAGPVALQVRYTLTLDDRQDVQVILWNR